jgi:hypothetical protein
LAKSSVTGERLRELLHYAPETGAFTWRARSRNGVQVGAVAGCGHGEGYWFIGIDGRRYFAHRLAWLYVHGAWPTADIDHINGVRNDNRIVNLRDVTRSVNLQNQRRAPNHNKSSGLLGASFNARKLKWKSTIGVGGKPRHLGFFATAQEAHAAYVAAKRDVHAGCSI